MPHFSGKKLKLTGERDSCSGPSVLVKLGLEPGSGESIDVHCVVCSMCKVTAEAQRGYLSTLVFEKESGFTPLISRWGKNSTPSRAPSPALAMGVWEAALTSEGWVEIPSIFRRSSLLRPCYAQGTICF